MFKKFFLTVVMSSFLVSSFAQTITLVTPQEKVSDFTRLMVPASPAISARNYILIDAKSGAVIAEKDSHEKIPPASLTKLMALYVIADALKNERISLDDPVRVSEKAWRTGGSKMFIKEGSFVKAGLLIQGIVTTSGNDATVAMAEYIAGSEDAFVDLMNKYAIKLGMKDTHFSDCNGLPSKDHYTTAYDLALLSKAFVNDFPEYYSWFSQKYLVYNNIKQANRNKLLWVDPSIDGIKTGHTDAAGYCLISSAKRDDMRLISVVLGEKTEKKRTVDSLGMLNYGFRFFESHKLYDEGAVVVEAKTKFAKKSTTKLGFNSDFYVTAPFGQSKNVTVKFENDDNFSAPVTIGQEVGKVVVTLDDKVLQESPLVALESNPKSGFLLNMFQHVMYSIMKLFS